MCILDDTKQALVNMASDGASDTNIIYYSCNNCYAIIVFRKIRQNERNDLNTKEQHEREMFVVCLNCFINKKRKDREPFFSRCAHCTQSKITTTKRIYCSNPVYFLAINKSNAWPTQVRVAYVEASAWYSNMKRKWKITRKFRSKCNECVIKYNVIRVVCARPRQTLANCFLQNCTRYESFY